MTVVGITMVYFALTMLVAVLVVLARIVHGADTAATKQRPTQPAVPSASTRDVSGTAGAGREAQRLELVALAAYGMHLRRRVAVRGSVASSPWSRAGRARQVLRFPGRG